MKMEEISKVTLAQLKVIDARISELKAQIRELEDEAYSLVPKHTFQECKAMGCQYTYRNKWDCHQRCVRRKDERGAVSDHYSPMPKTYRPERTYPTLGWKRVITRGMKWSGVWHGGWTVVKETPKTLILDDKTQLLKSTIFMLEDVAFIKSRIGSIYFCADDPDSMDMAYTLLDVRDAESCEEMKHCLRTPETPALDNKYATVSQQPDETDEEYEERIFGKDS